MEIVRNKEESKIRAHFADYKKIIIVIVRHEPRGGQRKLGFEVTASANTRNCVHFLPIQHG